MIVEITRNGGMKYKVLVPDDAPVENYKYGIIIGPPDLSGLNLPHEFEVRLNNELYNRGLITKKDIVRSRDNVIFGALQAMLKVDTQRITELYEPRR